MERRSIPHTNLEVSTLCLGTMTFGVPVAKKDAIHIVHAALDLGINFIDTANSYEGYNRVVGSAGGVAEEILGEALADRRGRAVITTKVGNAVGVRPHDKGLGRRHILSQIEASLKRLRTDYVDLYELHRPDPETTLRETIEVMAQLVRQGKVRHWGFSNFSAAQIREMASLCDENRWPRPVANQLLYNWLDRGVESEDVAVCLSHDIAMTPYQPLHGGLLTGKYRRGQPAPSGSRAAEHSKWLAPPDEQLFAKLDAFEKEVRASKLPAQQYAIKWLLDKPGVVSVIAGVKSVEQLKGLIPSECSR